jgi:hypothetical protein
MVPESTAGAEQSRIQNDQSFPLSRHFSNGLSASPRQTDQQMAAQRESFSMNLRLLAPTVANPVTNKIHGRFLGQLLRSRSPQFFGDQRQELFGCLKIALLDCEKDSRDVAHTGPEGAFKRSLSIAAYDLPNPLHAAHAAAFDHSKLEKTYFNKRSFFGFGLDGRKCGILERSLVPNSHPRNQKTENSSDAGFRNSSGLRITPGRTGRAKRRHS